MDYKFFMPTSVECGEGISSKIGEILKEKNLSKIMIVTDKGIIHAGLLGKVEESLNSSGIEHEKFDSVEPNPSAESIMEGKEATAKYKPDAILAVGGGSSIDTAKGIAVMANNEGHILDYEGVGKIKKKGLPLAVIPTTAGTGSEATAATIVTNTETHFKAAIISPFLFPEWAFLDPLLTIGLPQQITAATGMDALTHAIESYTSKAANPVSKALAIFAIKLIQENIYKAYFAGTDIKSRENMLVASMLAGAAFAQSRLGNVHAISHTFGGVFNIPHGIANATLLPFVMEFNLDACPQEMKEIAIALGCKIEGLSTSDAGKAAINMVKEMNAKMNIPSNIEDLGVTLEVLPKLVEDSMRSGNVLINPRLTTAADIQAIIESAYKGEVEFN